MRSTRIWLFFIALENEKVHSTLDFCAKTERKMKTMYKRMCDVAGVSVTKDAKSPYWVAQWTDARGKRLKRSTKVPRAGGVYRGERLTPAQARKRAEVVAWQLADAREAEYQKHDNTTVRELFEKMLAGALGLLMAGAKRRQLLRERRRENTPCGLFASGGGKSLLEERRRACSICRLPRRGAFRWLFYGVCPE